MAEKWVLDVNREKDGLGRGLGDKGDQTDFFLKLKILSTN